MSVQWDDFCRGVTDQRFILPVWTFHFDVDYVPTAWAPSQIQAAQNLIASTAVSAIRNIPGCPISGISTWSSSHPAQGKTDDEDDNQAFFTLANQIPVYDFAIQLRPKTFRLLKFRTSIADLIATVPILEDIATKLFAIGRGSDSTQDQPSLVKVLGLQDRIHAATFAFQHRIRTITYITQPNVEVTNVEVIKKLVNTELGPGSNAERQSPLGALHPEQIRRGDVTLSFTKTIMRRKRTVWVILECPVNITQKDIDLRFDYRCGEGGSAIEEVDISDWSVPFQGFYRDLILNKFLPALLHDIRIEPRIS
ncbi:MAG: hypothetical protein V1790_07555 [Planctomycetota bacterium]